MPSVDGVNYPGPWQIRLFYSAVELSVTYQHVLSMNVDVDTPPDPGSAFTDYDLPSRSGLVYNADTWVAAVLDDVKQFMRTDATFHRGEIWKYESGTNNASFQSSKVLNQAGNSASAVTNYSQTIFSMRSQNGGHAYFELLHTVIADGPKLGYSASSADAQDMFDLLTGLSSPMLARDGGYLFAPLFFLPGRSERYFKKKNR